MEKSEALKVVATFAVIAMIGKLQQSCQRVAVCDDIFPTVLQVLFLFMYMTKLVSSPKNAS